MSLKDLKTFLEVANAGSMSGAARRLNIPKSTVSRRVSRLEDELGVDLLHRTTRAIQLSNDGRALYARLEPLLSEVDGALQELSQRNETVSGCLRLTTTPAFGQSSTVVDCLATFGLKHPEISIDISLGQRVVDLVEEGFDVALRLHQHELPGRSSNMARHLFDFKWGFYASAQLLTTISPIEEIHHIDGQRFALHSSIDLEHANWTRKGEPLEKAPPIPPPKWRVDDSAVLEKLALSGAAVVLLETFTAEHLVASNQLIRVLPQYEWTAGRVSLVWPTTRHLSPKVRAFINHAVNEMTQPTR